MIRDTSGQDAPLSPSVSPRARRRIWVAVALAVTTGGAFAVKEWVTRDKSVDASKLRIAKVRRGTLVRDIAADARVTAANSPTLYATATGTIDLMSAAGDSVKLGQTVASIDSPELKSRLAQESATRDQLDAELGRFRLRVEQARAAAQSLVDQAKVDRQTAARELEQNRQGFENGAVPEITMLRAKDALAKAEISLAHARRNLSLENKGLEFERQSTRLQLERQKEVVRELERQVEALTIRSPADGVIGVVSVAQRAKVSERDPVLTVVDLSALELEIRVTESYARDLVVAMPAEVDIRGTKVAGLVRSVSPEVINGEVAARIEFADAPPSGLRQNQRLSARIVIEEKRDVLLVDRGPAIEANLAWAYFVAGGGAVRRPIRIGALGLAEVEVSDGANEGDVIVISGTDLFNNAERVRIAGDAAH